MTRYMVGEPPYRSLIDDASVVIDTTTVSHKTVVG